MLENEPEEKNPDQVVDNAVKELENDDAEDPVISSAWAELIKKFWKDEEGGIKTKSLLKAGKTTGIVAGVSAGAGLFLSYKVLRGAYEFAKKSIQGKIGFSEGYEIGQEMFSLDDKKDKK